MNREEIIRMAREAGLCVGTNLSGVVLVGAPAEIGLAHLTIEELERFAALVAAHEREAILDEWCMCVQSDLENGVKSLNERAAEKWHKEYPAISGFDAAIRARENT